MSPCEEVAEPGLELVSVWLWRWLFSSLWHFGALMLWDLRLKSLRSAVSCLVRQSSWVGVTGDVWDNVHSAFLEITVIVKCSRGTPCPLRRCEPLSQAACPASHGVGHPHVRKEALIPGQGADHTQTGQMCVCLSGFLTGSPASRWTGGAALTYAGPGGQTGGQASWESADLSGRASQEGTLVPGLRCEGPVRQERGFVGGPPFVGVPLDPQPQTQVRLVEPTRQWVKAEPVLKPVHKSHSVYSYHC